MQFTATATLEQRKKADLLIIPFWKGKGAALALGSLQKRVRPALQRGDFKAKEGETLLIYPEGEVEPRMLLLGLGDPNEACADTLRRAYSAVTTCARKHKWSALNLLLPKVKGLERSQLISAMADGLLLSNYAFDEYKVSSLKGEPTFLVRKASWVGATAAEVRIAKSRSSLFEGVTLTRDLINRNADEVTSQYLADLVRGWGDTYENVKVTVFDKARIQKEKMGLLLAVNQGSAVPPAFLIVQYRGAPPSSKEHTVLVGKGVTFDTGGLDIKPRDGMYTMKHDMSGAAAVLGTVVAAAQMGLKVNFTAVVPTTDNAVGSRSFKPGDVIVGYGGKSVEVSDTDAEGRLILADALAYATAKLKPTRMIDLATLTGSMFIALGDEISGVMSNDDQLAADLLAASAECDETLWRMPLPKSYRNKIRSDIADMTSCGTRAAGSITAALFLQEFVGETKWAHIDIAGTAYHDSVLSYDRKYATGFGVRLLIHLLQGARG